MSNNNSVILVTSSYDHTMIFWDALSEYTLQQIEYPENQIINRIEVSNDKRYLGCAANNQAKLYDIETSQQYSNTPEKVFDEYQNNVTSIGFQKDGNWIYTGSEDGSTKIWDLRASGYQRNYQSKEAINTLQLHPEEGELIAGDQSGQIKIYDLVADKLRTTMKVSPDIALRSISISYQAQYLAAANSSGQVMLYNFKGDELQLVKEFQAHNDYILKCIICPNMRYLATCSADKTAKLWSFQDNNEIGHLCTLYGHQKWVWDAAFSVDSDYLITGSTDCIAKIWDIKEAKDIRNLRAHKKGINCLAFHDTY